MGKTKETLNPNPKLSQNNSNVRALWTPQQIKIFCEACVDENTGKEYPRIKYKHKWDTLKKDWITWNKLKGSETGLGWDVAKGTIVATDEWWDRKLTEVPEAAKFREKGLDNIDLLDIMFKDTTATGNLAWTPSSGVLPTDFETPTEASSLEPGSSIRDVMERVCTLDGVEKGSNLYLMAARIFQK
uniref:Myb/SANT-like domain-containing protein n=1 Tax=Fagus sylvatica TaxID=28930 RepID=A0A2N9EEH3_FAGSY